MAICTVAAPVPAYAKVTAHAATATVNVTAVDFKFKLSATSAKPGKVTFKISNKGQVAHDFKINGDTSKLISPGQSTSITVNFKKAGSYPYLCTVPGHAQLGMKGTFKIT
jgi:nitrite reductase (NO-forming)